MKAAYPDMGQLVDEVARRVAHSSETGSLLKHLDAVWSAIDDDPGLAARKYASMCYWDLWDDLASIALCGWDGGTVNHRHLDSYMICLEQLAAARVPGRQPWREWQEDLVEAQRAELGRRLFAVAEPEPRSPDDPDLDQARAYLEVLGRGAEEFLFVAVHDQDTRAVPKHFFGTLDLVLPHLIRMQELNWGIFVTVNTTKGRRRRAVDVIEIRALFTELDGAPLAPVLACKLPPHIVVESSPGRYHCYWLTEDFPLDVFRPTQDTIQARFGGDAKDIARVLRVPGFQHQKRSPFTSRIVQISDLGPYSPEQVLAEFPPTWRSSAKVSGADDRFSGGANTPAEHHWFGRLDPEQADIEVGRMLGRLTAPEFGDYEQWLKISMAAYRAGASLATWDGWCRQLPGYDQAENWAKWDSGTLAMDREDGVTVGSLIWLAEQHGYQRPVWATRQPITSASQYLARFLEDHQP